MLFSITLFLGYLSSNWREELAYRMDLNSKDLDLCQSKTDGTVDVALTPAKNGRLPSFIRDKFAYFKLGSTLTYRRRLRDAETKALSLEQQCLILRQDAEQFQAKMDEVVRRFESKMAALTQAHSTQVAKMKQTKDDMQTKMDSVSKQNIALNDAKEKLAQQMKVTAAKLKAYESTKGALSGKLYLTEQKRDDLQKKLKALESKHAEQNRLFDTKFKKHLTAFDEKHAAQNAMFDTKYKEQQAMFDARCKQQKDAFDSSYKSQAALFHTKCSEHKAMFDTKVKQQEAAFTAKLRNMSLKCDAMEKQRDALMKRLGITETALVKSRQVKVNQEYQFTDAVSSLVPKDELLTKQDECVLYKKIMSVLAAMVLVLVTVVFIGFRFILY